MVSVLGHHRQEEDEADAQVAPQSRNRRWEEASASAGPGREDTRSAMCGAPTAVLRG